MTRSTIGEEELGALVEKYDDARELHREVVRHLVAQIAELTRERDRALACEKAALALLAEWRERVASPPSPTSAPPSGVCNGCGNTVPLEEGADGLMRLTSHDGGECFSSYTLDWKPPPTSEVTP